MVGEQASHQSLIGVEESEKHWYEQWQKVFSANLIYTMQTVFSACPSMPTAN